MEAIDDDTSDEEFDKAAEEAGKLLLEKAEGQFSGYLFLYWKLMKILEPKEIRLMDSLLQRPVAQRIVTKAWEEFVEAEKMKSDSKPFSLPDDYFKQDWDDFNPQEHFYIKGKIKARGPIVFAQFINYLADCSYISNDDVGEIAAGFPIDWPLPSTRRTAAHPMEWQEWQILRVDIHHPLFHRPRQLQEDAPIFHGVPNGLKIAYPCCRLGIPPFHGAALS